MTSTTTEPIRVHWTLTDIENRDAPVTTAADVNHLLALVDVGDIDPALVPFMAAAAAELALLAAIPWQFSADDPPVALLRLIAKVALIRPDIGGPHTARLLDQLR